MANDENNQKTYRAVAYITTRYEVDIIATSEEEAFDIAKNMDGGDFSEIKNSGVWQVDRVDLKEEWMIQVAEAGLFRHTFQNGQVMVTNLLFEKEEQQKQRKNFRTGEGLEHLKKEEQSSTEVFVPREQPKIVQTKMPGVTIVKKSQTTPPQQKNNELTDDARFLQAMNMSGIQRKNWWQFCRQLKSPSKDVF